MSLRNTLFKSIDESISRFILEVSNKYDINNSELENIWGSTLTKISVSSSFTSSVSSSFTSSVSSKEEVKEKPKDSNVSDLEAMKVSELKALCKAKGIKSGGKKADIVKRIVDFDSGESVSKNKTVSSKKNKNNIMKFLSKGKETIIIDENKHGNQEHKETGFVFNNEKVIGVQQEDGTIRELNEEDIDKCNCYKFEYKLPENLNKKIIESDLLSDEEESDIELEEEDSDNEDNEDNEDIELEEEDSDNEDIEEEEDSEEELVIEDSDEEDE